jgi:fucose permease
MISSAFLYIVSALSQSDLISLIACAITGFSVSLLWPGALILMEEKQSGVGIGAYALMAAGGDLGASLSPQLVGVIADKIKVSELGISLTEKLNLSIDQISMRGGMIIGLILCIIAVFVYFMILRTYRKKNSQ